MKKRIGVLALQGDVREHCHAIGKVGGHDALVRRPDDLQSIDGLIIPGGESTTIGKLLRIFEVMQPLRAAIQGGLPVFGTCAGMIVLAKEVIDGTHDQETLSTMNISVRRNAFGRQVDSFETELDLTSIGAARMNGIFIRAPWIEGHGEQVRILASVKHEGATHPVLAQEGKQLVASFHPEIVAEDRFEVHDYFIHEVAS